MIILTKKAIEGRRNVKKKEISSYEFTHDESVVFPLNEESIAKQMANECGGHIVIRNATFNHYISQEKRWSHYINCKK